MFGLLGKTVVGLDLGSSSIKVVQLKQNGGKWHLVSVGIADIPSEAQESKNPEIQRSAILDTIKRVFKENKIKAKRVITSLSGDAVIIRYVKLPYVTAEDLRGSIAKEAE